MCLPRPHKHRGSVTSAHHMAGDSQRENSLICFEGLQSVLTPGGTLLGAPSTPRGTTAGSRSQSLESSLSPYQ